jgi:phosphoglycolate phosphatase
VTSPAPSRYPRAVVFDLDGTLVDSAPDIALAINAAFAPLGVPAFDLATVKTMIGGGARAAIGRAAGLAGLTLSTPDEEAALARFYPVYAEASAKGRGLYPGARQVLDELERAGVVLGLCTNKAEPITAIALEALDIAGYFRSVVGARDDLPKKPDPTMLRAVLSGLSAAPADTVMIGDTTADIGAARAAGCRSIAIGHGYARVPVHQLGADATVTCLPEVPAVLARLGAIGHGA